MKPFTSPRTLGAAVALLGLSSFTVLGGACSSTDTPDGPTAEHLGAADQHLILGVLCPLLAVNGKVQICHHTGAASYPYTILKTSVQACINEHSGHANDYIAVLDPTCHGDGCLPVDAPCDANVPCCDGLTCQDGTCTDLCAGVTCAASDACHAAGTCDPATGLCSNPAAADGTACDDGDGCTVTDSCAAGTCAGSGTPCQNGGTCDPGEPYTCTCPAGFTGPNCETPTCVPTTCAAQGATCGTIDDGCGGTLTCGEPCVASACPCDDLIPAWQAALAGTILTDGSCDGYSFPGPCGSAPDHSWAFSVNGSNRTRIIAGDEGGTLFCGVQFHNSSFGCGGQGVEFQDGLTPAEAAACRAEVLNFAASQNVTCH